MSTRNVTWVLLGFVAALATSWRFVGFSSLVALRSLASSSVRLAAVSSFRARSLFVVCLSLSLVVLVVSCLVLLRTIRRVFCCACFVLCVCVWCSLE